MRKEPENKTKMDGTSINRVHQTEPRKLSVGEHARRPGEAIERAKHEQEKKNGPWSSWRAM